MDSDLSVVSMTAAEQGTEAIMEILKGEVTPAYAKESAAKLMEKIVQCNYDAQEKVLNMDGMSILMNVMENDENENVKAAAARAVSKLAARELRTKTKVGGYKAFPTLIQLLENSATKNRKQRPNGEIRVSYLIIFYTYTFIFNKINNFNQHKCVTIDI